MTSNVLGSDLEHALSRVGDLGQLPMHGHRRAHHFAAVDLPDGLMAEADAEQRNLRAGLGDEVEADAGLVGRAGAGREHDALGLQLQDFGDGDLVVAEHAAGCTQLAQVVDEVIGEAVVVIDQNQHVAAPALEVRRTNASSGSSG